MDDKTRDKNLIIAEILSCLSFILNTICVYTADKGTSFAPAWVTKLDFFYWLKTISAATGLVYLFISKVFFTKLVSRHLAFFVLIVLLYSIPFINTVFILIMGIIFKALQGSSTLEYEDRIIIQAIWLIPVSFIIINLFGERYKLIKKHE